MPVFLALTQYDTPEWRNLQLTKASIYLAIILLISMVAGSYILDFFNITLSALRIAGGIIIMRSGLDLLNTNVSKDKDIGQEGREEAIGKNDIALTPLAMPLLSGPGSISYMIGRGAQADDVWEYGTVLIGIAMIGLTTFVILRVAPRLVSLLGQSGITSMSRIMGFLSLALGVQFIVNGVSPLLGAALK
jgi:multiple antibiotic resistance protein